MENYYIDCSAELEDRDNAGLKDLSESLDLDWLEDKLEMKLEELAEKSSTLKPANIWL